MKLITVGLTILLCSIIPLHAASRAEMRSEAREALNELYSTTPAARHLAESAKAVLVFPKIVKAGFVVGAQRGDGTLLSHGKAIGYYRTHAASYGLQAGVQRFGYALFFMTDNDLAFSSRLDGLGVVHVGLGTGRQ